MKRMVFYSLLLLAAVMVPTETVELGALLPVQVVYLYEEADRVTIETDTENRGTGASVEKAIADLTESASGKMFLDTAEYLIVTEDTEHLINEVGAYLKGKTRLCIGTGKLDLGDAASYLNAHRPKTQLKTWNREQKLQMLEQKNGRFRLKEKIDQIMIKSA